MVFLCQIKYICDLESFVIESTDYNRQLNLGEQAKTCITYLYNLAFLLHNQKL